MTSGILNLDKMRGMTSHDVVNVVRRVTGIRRVGHCGALDPMATGVLLVCIDRATRLAEYLAASDKSYQATARLGAETDTYDAEGAVVTSSPIAVGRDEVEAALGQFLGPISQVPPMYSAVKRGGQPLHKLARRGLSVERSPRPVFVSHIRLTDWSPPELSFEVTCSAGTYVRSLAHDLGQRLGCGAHLTRLVRTRSGRFPLDQALPVAELTRTNWRDHLEPMELAVVDLPLVTLEAGEVEQIIHGRPVARRPQDPVAELARVQMPDGLFIALVRPSPDGAAWQPYKVFR